MAYQPPSGGCVLKRYWKNIAYSLQKPAAFGRLCVETRGLYPKNNECYSSRLRAAVC